MMPNDGNDKLDVINYEDKRLTLKFGSLNSAILIFQSTVGVSLFSLQKALQMVGLLWGGLLTLVGCYLTTYGLYLLSETAGLVEEERQLEKRLKNTEEMATYIDYRYINFTKWAMVFCGICIMTASTIANIFVIGRLSLTSDALRRFIRLESYIHKIDHLCCDDDRIHNHNRTREDPTAVVFHHCSDNQHR